MSTHMVRAALAGLAIALVPLTNANAKYTDYNGYHHHRVAKQTGSPSQTQPRQDHRNALFVIRIARPDRRRPASDDAIPRR
jgi:hypothetical protein